MEIGARTTGSVVKIFVTTGGTGYTEPPAVVVSGSGVTAYAHLQDTRVESIVIASGGTGRTTSPTVSILPPSTGVTISSFTAGTTNGTVTFDSALAATTWARLQADTDSVTISSFSNATQAIVAATTFAESGSATVYSGGTGAAATAFAYTGPLRPISFFKGRFNDVYGVDGMGRGFRWNGTDAAVEKIGIVKPAVGPSVVASTAANSGYLSSIQMVQGGAGYFKPPSVILTGGSPTEPATARAFVFDGRVTDVLVTNKGAGYQSTPNVAFSSGIGSGASFNVGVSGAVLGVDIINPGSGYTSNGTTSPSVEFATDSGLTNARAVASVDNNGKIVGIQVLNGGTGLTAASVSATVTGGGGTGAVIAVRPVYSVSSVTVGNSGSGYHTAPVLTFRAATTDPQGVGAAATVYVNTTGNVTGVSMISGGRYLAPPTAIILNTEAKAQATISQAMEGKYQCAIRYLDDTPEVERGPLASSISELVEVDITTPSSSLTWTFTHYGLDDRVHAMELWRTTADQTVALYRVATIKRADPAFTGTYTDTLSDPDLQDTEREQFGVMPIVLPSGQVNARRFGVLPGEFAVAAMFQDRAWFAVDTSGVRPNSLLYSEIDEPESVPPENELVLQENTLEPDKIVGMIPLGGQLLVAQSTHLYALTYVAQPILDASLLLVAYRGMLNSHCGDVMGGLAVMADSYGMYAFDGSSAEAISAPVDDYWRDGIIDFSKSSQFHVRADSATMTVRFYYCKSADAAPIRALCYCFATKAWWEEAYSVPVSATCRSQISNKNIILSGTTGGQFLKSAGLNDSGSAIPYQMRTGNLALVNENGDRAVGLVYRPTVSDSLLNIGLHYNNSPTPRANAVAADVGAGFSTTLGSTASVLNMNKARSPLGESSGFAQAHYSGRVDDRSAGSDRHVALAVSGEQSTDSVALYAIRMSGVT